MRVALLPVGPIRKMLLARLSDALAVYGFVCEVGPEVPMPPDAFDSRRRQYRAEGLLALTPDVGGDRVLAVTTEDVFAEGLHFVFGLATTGGRRALVSLHRLGTGDERLLLERVVKESVHEIGHTLGLGHCANAGCVMSFSNSLAEVDAKGRDFCDACRATLPRSVAPARA